MNEQYKEGETLISRQDEHDSDDGTMEFQIELPEQQVGSIRGSAASAASPPSKAWAWFYVISASIMASLGGVLFGYDMGIISGAILQLRDVFCLSCLDQELVISAMLMGAIVGSLVGGFLIDHCGRRSTIIANSVVFLVGALILGFSQSFAVLIVGRLLVGFAVSVSAIGECIYISEIAPAKRRGLLVSLNELGITLGLLLAYLCNFLFISISSGWRWMFALSAIPAVVQGIGMFFLPMSPRFLMLKKREEDAIKVLKKLRGTNKVDKEISGMRMSIASEKNQSCTDVCGSQDGMRGRMFIGVGLVFFQQFTGQPNVLYYAPTIFEEIGFKSNSAATLATVGLGVVKVLMTVVALFCVDRFGRRRLLYTGAIVMGISIFTLGIVCHFKDESASRKACVDHRHCQSSVAHKHSSNVITTVSPEVVTTIFQNLSNAKNKNSEITTQKSLFRREDKTTTSGINSHPAYNNNTLNTWNLSDNVSVSANVPLTSQNTPKNLSGHGDGHITEEIAAAKGGNSINNSLVQQIAGFTALMCYVAAYGFSFGPVTWLVLSEIFPAAVKGRAIAIATVFNWGTNLIVTFTFLDVMNALGVTWTFTIFGVICAFSVLFIYSFVPETKNRTLEQVSAEMKSKSPMLRMKQNWSQLCGVNRRALRSHSNYSRVQAETVT